MGSRISAARQDCFHFNVARLGCILQRHLHIQTLTRFTIGYFLTHLCSTIYLSSSVDAKEQSMLASPTNCSFQNKTQEQTELTCTSHSSSYTMTHPTCTSQTRTLDILSISPSFPFLSVLGCTGLPAMPGIERSLILNCFYLSGLFLIFLGFLCVRDGICRSIS